MSKGKPSRPSAPLPETELPEGWAFVRMDEACSRIQDGTHFSPKEQSLSGEYKYITAKNIKIWGIDLAEVTYISERLHRPIYERCNPERGDILYIKDGATTGIATVNGLDEEFSLLSSVALLKPRRDVLDPLFLKWYLNSPTGFKAMTDQMTGSAITRLTLETIRPSFMLIAPLAEQVRIVAKVEELMERVNAARARLASVPAILKRFRQSVLAAACSGQLTADWREAQAHLGTAKQLICSLRAISPTEADQEAEFPVKRWRLARLRQPQLDELPTIPESWAWVFLPDLGYMNRGRSRNRPRNAPYLYGGDIPFIQTGDVAQSRGRIVAHKQTYSEAGLAQSRLWPAGTICITIAANIADSAILTYPACFPDSVVGLLSDPQLCLAEFAEFFMRTAREDLSQFAPATAQKNINIGILEEVAVPLPPLEEQHEIVRRVEALFALADRIEGHVRTATVRAERLPQAILARAFSGELVPTEAELAAKEGRDYEPASELLARIRATKYAEPNAQKPKRRRPAGC